MHDALQLQDKLAERVPNGTAPNQPRVQRSATLGTNAAVPGVRCATPIHIKLRSRNGLTTETRRHGERSSCPPCLCVSVVRLGAARLAFGLGPDRVREARRRSLNLMRMGVGSATPGFGVAPRCGAKAGCENPLRRCPPGLSAAPAARAGRFGDAHLANARSCTGS